MTTEEIAGLEPFITANYANPDYYVKVQVKTNTQLHAAHKVVLNAFAALASPAPAESGEPVAAIVRYLELRDESCGFDSTDEERAISAAEIYAAAFASHPPAESAGSPSTSGVGVTWQPIETAPKDGTWFLGWVDRQDVEDQYDVWRWDAEAETDSGYGFWLNAADSNLDEFPTHWQPLPAAPTQDGGNG